MEGPAHEQQLRREIEALTGKEVSHIGFSDEAGILTLWLIHNGTTHRTELAGKDFRSRVDAYCRIFDPTPQGLAEAARFMSRV